MSVPKRRLSGYPLAYEDGTDTVFRNFGEVDIHSPMKMEQTQCSETSAYKLQTPGNYPKESIQLKISLQNMRLHKKKMCNCNTPASSLVPETAACPHYAGTLWSSPVAGCEVTSVLWTLHGEPHSWNIRHHLQCNSHCDFHLRLS